MIKVNNPLRYAKLFLRYTGKRLNYIYEKPSFKLVNLDYDKCFDFAKEPIAIKVLLIDGTEIYIGILSRKVYKLNHLNQWIVDEQSFLMHQDIIVEKSIIYFSGNIVNTISLNGEMIEDLYKYRLFVSVDCSRLFKYIDIYSDELIIEDYR